MLNTCKGCGENNFSINYSEGNVTCTYCGLVQSTRIIDETSEWRNFANESSSKGAGDNQRAGEANNDLLPSRGLCTIISGKNDSDLVRYSQRSSQNSNERALERAFKSIKELCQLLTLSDVVNEEACFLFKKVNEQKNLKGRSHQAIISACVFIACRIKNKPRTIKEIASSMNIDKLDILKCHSIIKKLEPIKPTNKSASEYAKRYAYELNYNEMATRYSQVIADKTIDMGLVTGKSPLSVASAVVYMVGKLSGDFRSYAEIKEVSDVNLVTIKNCYKSIIPHLDEILKELPHGWSKAEVDRDKGR